MLTLDKIWRFIRTILTRLVDPFQSKSPARNTKVEKLSQFQTEGDLAHSYFQKHNFIWHVVLYSTPIDVLWFLINDSQLKQLIIFQPLMQIVVPIIIISVLCSFRQSILQVIKRADYYKKRLRTFFKKYPFVIPALIALGIAIEAYGRMETSGFIPMAVFLLLMAISLPSWISSFKQQQKRKELVRSQLEHLLPAKNLQYFIVNITPVLGARICGFILIFHATIYQGDDFLAASYLAAQILALMTLQPERADYLAKCMLCANETSLVGISEDRCPECVVELRERIYRSREATQTVEIKGSTVEEKMDMLSKVMKSLMKGQAQVFINPSTEDSKKNPEK